MKKEYDFSKGERGKFYRSIEELEIPIYLDKEVKDFYLRIAEKKKTDINSIINKILKNEMTIHKIIE